MTTRQSSNHTYSQIEDKAFIAKTKIKESNNKYHQSTRHWVQDKDHQASAS
jgi:hypothetical protein